jgi:hypothetical protein
VQYQKAADQGYGGAQNNLGSMYYKAQGVPQNYAEAVKWYRKAADQGNAVARYNLGAMYANGKGVPLDNKEAAKWFHLAADQGNAEAQNYLKSLTTGRPAAALPDLQQRIDDARALTAEQWAADRELITRIEIGYKCGALGPNQSADLAFIGVQNIMFKQQVANGLIDDSTIDLRQETAKAVEQGRLLVDNKSDPGFCSRFFSDPADRARLRQIVSDLMHYQP